MLINSLVVFLSDLLPIFMLVGLLLWPSPQRPWWLLSGLLWGVGLSTLLLVYSTTLSSLFGGIGFELISVAGLALFLVSIATYLHPAVTSAYRSVAAIVALAALSTLNLLNGLAYWTSAFDLTRYPSHLLMGSALGLGISLSLACLIYLALSIIDRTRLKHLLLSFFTASQFASLADILEQIDWLPTSPTLWNSSALIADDSEYGMLLRVMMGYEATPTLAYMLMFAGTLAVLMTVSFWRTAS